MNTHRDAQSNLWVSLFGRQWLAKVLILVSATIGMAAYAAPPVVSTVPVAAEDPIQPHDLISGKPTTLKGAVDEASVGSTWTWDPGDGSPSVSGTVDPSPTSFAQTDDVGFTPYFAIWIEHTYNGDDGDVILATLTVTNGLGESSSAVYRMRVRDITLPVEVNTAIDEALWFMHRNQYRFNGAAAQGNGSTSGGAIPMAKWDFPQTGGLSHTTSTAAAVNAFEANGYTETDGPASPYTETVTRGLRYVIATLTSQATPPQTFGRPAGFPDDPDTNGNGFGVYVNGYQPPYQVGMAMDAIVASGTPDTVAITGPANVIGRTYKDIVQDMVDWYAWAQGDGTNTGGWRYGAWNNTTGQIDNSTSGWAAIGFLAAEEVFGLTVPEWVKTRNEAGLELTDTESSANNADGQHGYTNSPSPAWGGFSVTGAALVEMAMDDIQSTTSATPDERWIRAENYFRRHFGQPISGNNIRNYYYAMFNFAKAMRTAVPEEVVIIGTNNSVGCGPNGGAIGCGATLAPLDWYSDPVIGLARTVVDFQTTAGVNIGMFTDRPGNSQGGNQDEHNTSWATQILTRTLFQAGPVARASASPNPGALNTPIGFDGSQSFHQDPARSLVLYEWDFDNDGVFDATGETAARSFSEILCPDIPCTLPVTLRVTDDNVPARFDTDIVIVEITIPPHPPTAVAGGPYLMCTVEEYPLDGSSSFDIDEGDSETGQPPFDTITGYAWELDGISPFDFDEASGAEPLVSFPVPGIRDIGLRVTDNTSQAFPSAQQPDLTDSSFTTVEVADCSCIGPVSARTKPGKAQLVWAPVAGAEGYDILRSFEPNRGFELVATDHVTDYATYLQRGLDNGTTYWYRVVPKGADGMAICPLSQAVSATPQEGRRGTRPDVVPVPDVTGLVQSDAENTLAQADLGVGNITFENSDTVPEGAVIRSDPAAGTSVVVGTLVDLVVSLGPVRVEVPDVVGETQAAAEAAIVGAGLTVGTVGTANSDTVAAGLVISQDPVGGLLVVAGSAVDIVVSLGPQTTAVPDVVGLPQAAAESAITSASLTVGTVSTANSDVVPAGNVISQNPAAGTVVILNTPVDIVVSLGPQTVAVPNVINQSQAAAEAAIVGAGLSVGTISTQSSSTIVAGNVINQSPGAGSLVLPGAPVDLVVSLGAIQVTVPDVVGITQEAAEAAIVGADLTVGAVSTANSDTVPAGDVISQNPTAGTVVDEFSPVDLVVSLGPVQVTVPDVVGLSQAAAEAAIVAADLTVGAVTTANSDTVPAGDVISQNPTAGSVVDESSTVDLVVSLGPVQVTVPFVEGLSQAAAEAAIVGVNLTVGTVSTANSNTVPAGDVIIQNPIAGIVVDEFSPVDLVVSLGPVQVTVPNVVSLSQAAAEAAIVSANLTVGAVTAANSDSVPEGDVISQNPAAGASVDENSAVDIVISLGPLVVPVTVPNVVGLSQAAAEAAIVAADLTVGTVSTQNSDTVPAGDVISQNPPAGASVAENSAVDIVVSLGPVTVVVPDVVSLTEAGASANILAAGLTVGTVSTQSSDTVPAGDVISQNPGAGAIVVEGSAIDLVVSTGPASADDVPPVLVATLNADPAIYNAGTNAVVTAVATDDSGVPPVITMTLDGAAIPVTLPDTFIDTTALAPGSSHTVVVTATDGASNSVSETLVFFVRDPSASTIPTVTLTAPANDATITEPTDIIGTASDADLAEYRLEYAPIGTSEFVLFASGDSSVTADVLGQFDTSQVTNGTYIVRLSALNLGGNSASTSINVVVEGGAKLGQFAVSFTDKSVSIGAFPLQVMRNYDSRNRGTQGDFGYGWGLGLSEAFLTENRVMGASWTQSSSGGFLPTYSLFESQPHVITVKLEEGDEQRFRPVPDPSSQRLSPIQLLNSVNFVGIGAEGTLTPLGGAAAFVLPGAAGPNEIFDFDFDLYQPSGYFYNAPDGFGYTFTRFLGGLRHKLTGITDPNGTTISLNPGGIIRSDGISIAFVRDGQGRITQITDPNGNVVTYSYDIRGDLVGVTDAEGNTTQFIYNSEHFLMEIRDPLGRPVQRQEYDADGRLIGITDANGERVVIEYDLNAQSQIVRDRRGNPTIYEYDADGNVTSQTDIPFVNGVATPVTSLRTYNASNLLTSETDPLGNVQSFTYDASDNLLTRMDALGNTESFTYNAKNQVLSNTDKNGNTTSNTYDANGRLTSTTDGAGNTTSYTYDASGNRLTKTDPLGNVTTFTYDGNGRLQTRTDPLGNVTTYEYDTNGNRTAEINALGNRTEFLYDANDQLIQTTDALGNISRIEYDALGRQIVEINTLGNRTETVYGGGGEIDRIDYADGTSTAYTYDPDGNRATVSNRNGLTTAFTYDVLDKVVDVQFPDGSGRTKRYDEVSNLSGEVDELGNLTVHEYDAVGRRTLTRQPNGAETRYEYDANGNRIAVVDANGNRTEFTFDALNRQTVTTFPDGNTATVSYDALGRELTKTDPMGNVTTYAYDANGNLTQVTDALGGATQYAYDAVGNIVAQTDANGNVTTFAYDALSRKLSRTLALGQQELFVYDSVGNMTEHTDFNGNVHTFAYDEVGRQLTANYADGSTVTTTYNGEGAPLTINDSLGLTTQTYDNRGRLVSRTDSAGLTVAYTYDATGQQTSVTSPGGAVTSHTYDSLQRLSTTTDVDGGVTTYLYDSVGNLAEVQNPNGTEAVNTYNSRDQLISLVNRDSGTTVISSYAYTLNANGMRTRIDEGAGNVVDYVYDATMRLLRETRSGANAFDDQYTYDAVGNRLSVNRDGTVTNYTYDSNDRLLTAGAKANAYDSNGNLVQLTDGVDVTTYEYDSLNRLTRTVAPGAVVTQYQYDAEGNRVTRRNGAGAVLARYALDTRSITGVPQILEERDASSAVQVHYTHGADLISQKRGPTRSYYHYDGLGSTRALSDVAEAVTDNYLYDAYGRQVASSGSTLNEFRYTGEQFDSSLGFYFLRARYYDQSSGRFISMDPFAGDPQSPMSLHRYLYANNNPVHYVDPNGQFGLVSISISISISTNLRSVYTQNLVKFFLKALKIAYCCLEPAYRMQDLAYSMIASNTPGGFELFQLSRNLIAQGYKAIGAEIVQTYKNIANDMVSVKVEIGGLLGDLINSAQSGTVPIPVPEEIAKLIEYKEKIEGWLDEFSAVLNDIETFVNGNNCQKFTVLANRADQIAGFIPSF